MKGGAPPAAVLRYANFSTVAACMRKRMQAPLIWISERERPVGPGGGRRLLHGIAFFFSYAIVFCMQKQSPFVKSDMKYGFARLYALKNLFIRAGHFFRAYKRKNTPGKRSSPESISRKKAIL
jgi:hypothetical protein